ncbi:MAG: GNAT family N-acetyltransferase [Ferruginibacter sp.]|nr:GNAT family N-acetyltransferase [Ferruginibacter sp.]
MHLQINPYLLYEPMDEELFRPIFEKLLQEKVLYKYVNNNEDVGMCKLILQQYRDGHKLYIGGFAVDTKHVGKNYGYKIMQEIIAFAKNHNRSRVELTVSTQNEKAIALYKKCGFEIEGTLKNFTHFIKENRFGDEYMMSLIINENMEKKKLLFVCIENSNRSQMSQAFAKIIGGNNVEAYSAGSKPSGIVNPKAIAAMAELGYDLSTHDSKSLDEVKAFVPFDAVVTMGCGDACPWMPAKQFIDWQIPDPKHMEPTQFNEVRDYIKSKVGELINSLI